MIVKGYTGKPVGQAALGRLHECRACVIVHLVMIERTHLLDEERTRGDSRGFIDAVFECADEMVDANLQGDLEASAQEALGLTLHHVIHHNSGAKRQDRHDQHPD